MRFQFPLYKLFVIFVAWALALGACSRHGNEGIVVAAFTATSASLLIFSIHSKKDVLSGIIAAAGSLIGAFFASIIFSPAINNGYNIAAIARDGIIVSVGAIIGGIVFSWASKR